MSKPEEQRIMEDIDSSTTHVGQKPDTLPPTSRELEEQKMVDAMEIINNKIEMCTVNMNTPGLKEDKGIVAFWKGQNRDFEAIKEALSQAIPSSEVAGLLDKWTKIEEESALHVVDCILDVQALLNNTVAGEKNPDKTKEGE